MLRIKSVSLIGLGLLLVASLTYAADESQDLAPIIGVINWRAVVFSTEQAQQTQEEIEARFQKDAENLQALESRIRDNESKLQQNQEIMTEKQIEELVAELQADVGEYQAQSQELQNSIQEAEEAFIEEQNEKIKPIVEKISQDRNLHAILREDTVIYGRLTIDITGEVIDILNQEGQ